MEYDYHLCVAHETPNENAENPSFIPLLGKNLRLLMSSRFFLHTTRVGQKFAMRPQVLKTLDLNMNLYSWYPERRR